jgi:hypothetical protein
MPTFAFLTAPINLTVNLLRSQNAPLPLVKNLDETKASVDNLMPDYFPRKNARLVSCYALFK